MKRITYAGESVLTTDEVATALVKLTAALAKRGMAEAVEIPICDDTGTNCHTAELVIGQGNDVLAVPANFTGTDPDFTADATRLRHQLDTLNRPATASTAAQPGQEGGEGIDDFDYDFPSSPAYFETDTNTP